jgi:p21-activated kinase 1
MDDSSTKTPSRRLTKKPPPSLSASSSTATSNTTATTTATNSTTSTSSSSSSSPYLVGSDRFDHHHTHQYNRSVQHPPATAHHLHHHAYGHSHHQLHSQRSSASLQRSPSAPTYPRYHTPPALGRSRTGSVNPASSNSSLDRPADRDRDRDRERERRTSGISGPLPILAGSESVAPSGTGGGQRLSNPSRPLAEKASDDFIGAPFDGSEIFSRLELTKVPGYNSSVRKAPPPPLAHPPEPSAMADIPLQHSASSSSGEKSAPRVAENQLISPKRYSDEGKEPRQGMIRKKSGFSGFMSSIGVGSPRGVKISAPENPVHVTHVGYDNQTGQFTV